MPAATRQGDMDTGHDLCPPRALEGCSPNVIINGRGAGRQGDNYPPHGCIIHNPPHDGVIASGSSTVYINGRRAARVGDSVSCGGSVATGSPSVIIGG